MFRQWIYLPSLLDFISYWVLSESQASFGKAKAKEVERSRVLSVGCTDERAYSELRWRAEQVKEPVGCVELDHCLPERLPFWKCAMYEVEPWKIMWQFVRFHRWGLDLGYVHFITYAPILLELCLIRHSSVRYCICLKWLVRLWHVSVQHELCTIPTLGSIAGPHPLALSLP